jgi:hypothetical protein
MNEILVDGSQLFAKCTVQLLDDFRFSIHGGIVQQIERAELLQIEQTQRQQNLPGQRPSVELEPELGLPLPSSSLQQHPGSRLAGAVLLKSA